MMTLYHGSYAEVRNPDVDFGILSSRRMILSGLLMSWTVGTVAVCSVATILSKVEWRMIM